MPVQHVVNLLNIDTVIRHKHLPVPHKLHCDFGFTHAAFSGDEHTFAVDDHEVAGERLFRRQPLIQKGDEVDHHPVGIALSAENRKIPLNRNLFQNRRNLIVFGDDEHRRKSVGDGRKPPALLIFGQVADILDLLVSDDYDTARLRQFEIAGQFKARPVDIRYDNPAVQGFLVAGALLQAEKIHDFTDHYLFFIVVCH